MSIPPEQAAQALRDVETAQQRSVTAYRYQRFSAHLFLWGAIWVIGYAVQYWRPGAWKIWLALAPAGILGSVWIDKRARGNSRGWNHGVSCLAIFLYILAVFAVLPPKSDAQAVAIFPLLIALLYALVGVWTRAARIVLLGFALGVFTVAGFFWLPQYFALWMAVVGGGALILGGFWLRRI